MGYTAEQARTFLIWGCYEWAVRDSANDTFGAAVNLLKPVEEMMAEAAEGRLPAPDFDAFKAFGHTARWHYIFGKATGATPDGRKSGEEISKNVSPTMGADTEGATALVASAASIDALNLPGDYPLDVALLPATASGEKGLLLMRSLIEEYFSHGGLVIQFNVHDADTLRDAQRHPEKYENLQVRVAGWNVRWNDIPKAEQDKFIRRAESIGR